MDPVPRLSILIPALDGYFEDTLASVLQLRPDYQAAREELARLKKS